MSTLASPAIYNPIQGVVIPEIKPPYQPAKVVVVYWDEKESESIKAEKPLSADFVEAFKATKGILLKSHPDGVTYENRIRQDAEKHFFDKNHLEK